MLDPYIIFFRLTQTFFALQLETYGFNQLLWKLNNIDNCPAYNQNRHIQTAMCAVHAIKIQHKQQIFHRSSRIYLITPIKWTMQLTFHHKYHALMVCFHYQRIHRHCRQLAVAYPAPDVSTQTSSLDVPITPS